MRDGSEAGDLMIENERLHTALKILQSKQKCQDDSEAIIKQLKRELRDLEEEKDKKIKSLEEEKDKKIKSLQN